MWFQKISIPLPQKGLDFPARRGAGGVNLTNIPVGEEGCTIP